MIKAASDQETALQVVRGERPWVDLNALGMEIRVEEDQCHFHNPRGIEVKASAHDLARGLWTLRLDPVKLREWAFVMEAADFELEMGDNPSGDILLNALWSASFGEQLGKDALQAIEQLAVGHNGDS